MLLVPLSSINCQFEFTWQVSVNSLVNLPSASITTVSRESDSTIANVRLSVRQSQKPLSLSEMLLSAIEPIDHRAYRPSSLLTIKSLLTSGLLSRLLNLLAC